VQRQPQRIKKYFEHDPVRYAAWFKYIDADSINSDGLTLLFNATMLFDHAGMSALARLSGIDELRAGAFGTADQLWTVVIEWWIYVAFGIFAFAVLQRRLPSPAQSILLVFALLAPCYLLWRGNGLFIAWIVGMLGAIYQTRLIDIRRPYLLTATGVLGAISIWLALSSGFDFYQPLFATIFSFFLLSAHQWFSLSFSPSPKSLLVRALTALSEVSYSVYLVHLSVLFWVVAWKPYLIESMTTLLILVGLSNAVAIVFYFSFERHYLFVRRCLGYIKTRLAVQS
jgi:peptidoglycan/LPS O-acetylase OafA/YrhL